MAVASDLANRAAKVFSETCLIDEVLAIQAGSSSEVAIAAGLAAKSAFASLDRKGLTRQLASDPRYTVAQDQKSGRFHCHVSSKDLTAAEVVMFFDFLSRKAGEGARPSRVGEAKWDDGDPNRNVDGQRAEFRSKGRKLTLELFHYVGQYGPVGSLTVVIEHQVGRPRP